MYKNVVIMFFQVRAFLFRSIFWLEHRVNFSYVNPVSKRASSSTRKNMLTVSCDTPYA